MTEPADNAATRALMAERYGTASPRRRWLGIVGLGVLVAGLLAWLIWAAWVHATTSITGEVVSFDVVSQHRMKVTVQIGRPGGTKVQCTVQAEAVDHSLVGQVVVSVPASAASGAEIDATIKTDREATSASVTDCH